MSVDNIINKHKREIKARVKLACQMLRSDMVARTSGHYGEEHKAVDKGNYKNSFNHLINVDGLIITGVVVNNADYAHLIELGTVKMRPRPIIKTSSEGQKSNIKKILGAK